MDCKDFLTWLDGYIDGVTESTVGDVNYEVFLVIKNKIKEVKTGNTQKTLIFDSDNSTLA